MPYAREALTEQFYTWERRGRGWQVFECPVALEPPFRPFLGHVLPPTSGSEDARRPSLFGGFIEALRGESPHAPVVSEPALIDEFPEPEAELFVYDSDLVEIEIGAPADLKVSRDRMGQIIKRLGVGWNPITFEAIGVGDSVSLQFVCAANDRAEVIRQIGAYMPELILRERERSLGDQWRASGPETIVVDFGLSREFMLPFATRRDLEIDPLIPFVAALGDLGPGELGMLQVIFESVRAPWTESILRAVTDYEGHAFFSDGPELVSRAREKVSHPLYAAVIRVVARAESEQRAWQIARSVGAGLVQFADPGGNEFIPLANDGYPNEDHIADVLGRVSRRAGMLLNSEEIISFVHPPGASIKSPKLKRIEKRTKAAPDAVLGHRLVLGENNHAGRTRIVSQSPAQRVRHTYVIGASGTGKSTLLLSLITQDIEHGDGIAVFDPHGDLIDEILGRIPESRLDDVILFDPADEEYAIGFNILDAHSDLEKTLLASDLVAVFRRLSTSWGDQMTSVLGNGILAFLESRTGGTLADLRRFLVDPDYRKSFLTTVRDEEVVYYWQKEFPLLSGRPQAPILTRLDTFLRPRLVRHMVSQKKNRLDFAAMMNEGKILLAKLAQGAIGEENSFLLGSLLVSKFHQMALARQGQREEERRSFYLYIDEFHNFVTPSLASILSGVRKYRLGLVLAHQELRQLASRDADVASAVLSNPCTRICFRVGDADAKKLEDGFTSFDAKDLQNLGIGEAICRVERADHDFNLKTLAIAPNPEGAERRRGRIVELSRGRYGFRRDAAEPRTSPVTERPSVDAGDTAGTAASAGATTQSVKAAGSRKKPENVREAESGGETLGGRGGAQHKYLQELIRRWAEGRGYRVAIEKPILDGLGIVDVAIERAGRAPIACEISVTTSPEYELGHAQKCFAAGFEHVFLVAPDKEVLARVRAKAAAILTPTQMKKTQFVLPEQVFAAVSVLESNHSQPQSSPEAKELLTAKEVEELLRIDVKTIYNYVQRGLIPYVRIQSNLRFLKSEIVAWVGEHKSGSRSQKRK